MRSNISFFIHALSGKNMCERAKTYSSSYAIELEDPLIPLAFYAKLSYFFWKLSDYFQAQSNSWSPSIGTVVDCPAKRFRLVEAPIILNDVHHL